MSATRKTRTSEVSLVVFHSEYDPECVMCDQYIDIRGIGVLIGDEFACPSCIDQYKPGYAEIVKALDLIFDTVTYDLGPITTPPVVDVLRGLADVLQELAEGKLQIQRNDTLVPDPFNPNEFCGVQVDRRLVSTEEGQ